MTHGFTPHPTADSFLDTIDTSRREYTRHVFQDWGTCMDVANECGKLGWRIIHIHDDQTTGSKYRMINVVFERELTEPLAPR
ncbi:MAG: hypothetical protein ACR2RF_20610 [Geminicoccaceae bacterium]